MAYGLSSSISLFILSLINCFNKGLTSFAYLSNNGRILSKACLRLSINSGLFNPSKYSVNSARLLSGL